MQTPTSILPESEKIRLEKWAYEYADNSHDLYATTHTASSISYFAGAKAEYIASLSRQKAMAIAFWKFCVKKDYNLTLAADEIYAEFESLNKQDGTE